MQGNYQTVYKNDSIEIVNEYAYLGILYRIAGSFNKAKQEIAKGQCSHVFTI